MSEDIVKINCSYIPPEIITAAGYQFNRVWPNNIGSKGKKLLPTNYCPYSQAFLSKIIDEPEKLILANSCDAMRRIYDITHNKSYLLQVPRKINKTNISFYKEKLSEMNKFLLKEKNRQFQNKNLGNERLKEEVKEFNEIRKLMKKLRDEILKNDKASFSILIEALKNLYYNKDKEKIKRLIKKIKNDSAVKNNDYAPKIIISSSCLLGKSLINKVENSGMEVVAIDSCLGERTFDFEVKNNNDDLIGNLAKSYLNKKSCPRMMEMDKRLDEVKNLIFQRKADGLIYFIPKFCDQSIYDFKYLKEWAQKSNFPILKLEGEYNAGQRGQLTTRIEAFKESLTFAVNDEV
ncbi:MAG: 2-hydroxyacyl-CoA dehydratase family protein [Bacillota bacterium]